MNDQPDDQPDISDDGKLIHALAEQVNSLRAENETFKANPQVGVCVICGSAIWQREARMSDERGTFHPLCAAINQLTSHRLLLDEMVGVLRDAQGHIGLEATALGRTGEWSGTPILTGITAALTKYQQQCGEKVKV